MRIFLAGIAFILFNSSAFAQNPEVMGNRGGNQRNGQQMMGRLYGKIVDSVTNKPVEFASVQLIQNRYDSVKKSRKDAVIAGMLTKANGDFSLENIPVFGQYKLKITVVGFRPVEKQVSFGFNKSNGQNNGDMSNMLTALDKDLGNIKLFIEDKVLDNVTVTASKPLFQMGIDKKVFNVDKNIVSAGGTGVDVMRNVPSLNVDIDGNVTLRNNAPQIFVDGRPTTMTLDQIPADAIESVEIITNPSAKYDASGGTSGILNIVLKKNRKVGYNGSLRLNADSRGRIGGGANINLRQNKVNFFASLNYNQRRSISKGETERTTFLTDTTTKLNQNDKSTWNGNFGFARAGFDYFMNNRNTISITGNFGGGEMKPHSESDIYSEYMLPSPILQYSERNSISKNNFRNTGIQLSYKHNFPRNGQELTADITYNKSKNDNTNTVTTDYYNGNIIANNFIQQQIGKGDNKHIIIQSDYVNPINDKMKVEMGVRAAIRENNSVNDFYTYDDSTGSYIFNPVQSNSYDSKDHVYAAYTTFTNQLNNFGYQVGLRAESSAYEGFLPAKNESFETNFPISFFPSAFLSQKLKNDQELQLNYTRRINRPNFWQLYPYIDYSDSLNLDRGNPDLKPEFTNSLELSYQKLFKNRDNFIASLYFKNTNHLITRTLAPDSTTGKPVFISTYINANSSYVTGLELISKNKISKWWEITSNFNLYTSKIKIDDPNLPKQQQFASWFAKINNSFKLPKNFSIQLSGDYQSKSILPPGGSGQSRGGRGGWGGQSSAAQGFVRPNYGVDAAVRFDFLKNNAASISLNVNDIFRTRKQDIHSESAGFVQDAVRWRDAQIFRLNFNWRFGKFDANLFKRKNSRSDNLENDNGQQF